VRPVAPKRALPVSLRRRYRTQTFLSGLDSCRAVDKTRGGERAIAASPFEGLGGGPFGGRGLTPWAVLAAGDVGEVLRPLSPGMTRRGGLHDERPPLMARSLRKDWFPPGVARLGPRSKYRRRVKRLWVMV
jgi:hypothetical protein